MSEPTTVPCKGAWSLRNNCKRCTRCLETAGPVIEELRLDLEMYQSAWLRELGGLLIPKRHRIDALVLTTRRMREELLTYRREGAAARAFAAQEPLRECEAAWEAAASCFTTSDDGGKPEATDA